jgi:hypothetical protein
LLCRAAIALDRTIPPERMTAFQFVGVAAPDSDRPDIGSTKSEVFRTREGAGIATNHPVFKAALACLAGRAPVAFSFDELCAATRDRLTGTTVAEPVHDDEVSRHVAELLRQGALARLVELHVRRPRPAPPVSDRATARRRARSRRSKLRTAAR